MCVTGVCAAPAVTSVDPADGATGADALGIIQITFNGAMDPGTLSYKSVLDSGACAGTIQVSTDDFATCILFSSAVMTSGNRIAQLTPAPALSFGSTYKVRVTTGAQSWTNVALGTEFDMTTGFLTRLSPATSGVVISQVYGAGGNAGATWLNDFIELHNRGGTAVSLAGWSVQYSTAAGGNWQVTPLSGSIPAGGYYLVQEAGGGSGSALPTADATGSIALAAGAGRVALATSTTAFTSGSCSIGQLVLVDLLGYGGTATCHEGSAAAPAPTTTTTDLRAAYGCTDTDQNGSDFAAVSATAPGPRNSSSQVSACRPVHNESGDAAEADYCALLSPASISVQTGTALPTVTGTIYEATVTEAAGASAKVTAEFSYGPRATNPEDESLGGWNFIGANYDVQDGNNDRYKYNGTAPAAGDYSYTFRFSLDGGLSWTYCDDNGAGSNSGLVFETPHLPLMHVTP